MERWARAPKPRTLEELYGLVVDGKNLTVITSKAVHALILSQLQFLLWRDVKVHSQVAGVQWWRLGPLSESEVWCFKDLIVQNCLLAKVGQGGVPFGPDAACSLQPLETPPVLRWAPVRGPVMKPTW
jgi:hypothetical protein